MGFCRVVAMSSRPPAPQGRQLLPFLAFAAALGCVPLFFDADTRGLPSVDWPDVVGEGALVVLILGWAFVLRRVQLPWRVWWPMAGGVVALCAGAVQDVLDEFFVIHIHYGSAVENLGKVAGTLLGALGIYRWNQNERRRSQALEESSKRFQKLSTTDSLTGLYNRSFFFERLAALMPATTDDAPLGLIVLDIDDFKDFNDTFGHVEGDRVIRALGEVVRESVRDSDIGCRYGGEELVVLLPGADETMAEQVAERVRGAMAARIFRPRRGQAIHKTVSIGVAVASPDESPEAFVHRADEAMYDAKRSGKNQVAAAS